MTIRELINDELMDSEVRDEGYDVKNIVVSALPWKGLDEVRVILNGGVVLAAIYQDGKRLAPYQELKEPQK